MFLCNTNPPSSLSAGFPNKVATLPQQLLSLLACHVVNGMSLDWVRVHVCAKSLQPCLTLCNPIDCSPPGSSVHGISPGKNTGVGCRFLLQGIFPTQELNLHFLHWFFTTSTTWEVHSKHRTCSSSSLMGTFCSQTKQKSLFGGWLWMFSTSSPTPAVPATLSSITVETSYQEHYLSHSNQYQCCKELLTYRKTHDERVVSWSFIWGSFWRLKSRKEPLSWLWGTALKKEGRNQFIYDFGKEIHVVKHMSWRVCVSLSNFATLWLFATLWTIAHFCPWNSPGKNTGVSSSHSLLQQIFLTWGLNLGLLHCRGFFTVWATWETHMSWYKISNAYIKRRKYCRSYRTDVSS